MDNRTLREEPRHALLGQRREGVAEVPFTDARGRCDLARHLRLARSEGVGPVAYRRLLQGVMPYVSVVADIALLMGLIYSYHYKYAQEAVFYLKVPTLLYVFLFIALRALRFEARFVVFTGLVAVAGSALAASLFTRRARIRSFIVVQSSLFRRRASVTSGSSRIQRGSSTSAPWHRA